MGLALESVLGFNDSLSAGSALSPLTPGSGQSFQVRSYVDGTAAWLEDIWATALAHPAQLSIKSPRMHDNVKGILMAFTSLDGGGDLSFNPQNILPGYLTNRLYSTDVLQVNAIGTSTDKVAALFNVRYENLGGVDARLATWDQITGNYDNLVGILTQPVASATVGQWGPGVALNAVDNRLDADTDYAWLGYSSSIPVTAITMDGVDLGKLFVGGPGFWDLSQGGDFFVKQSKTYNTAHIPVINSNNAGNIFVQIADIVASTAPNVTLFFAQLRNKFTG